MSGAYNRRMQHSLRVLCDATRYAVNAYGVVDLGDLWEFKRLAPLEWRSCVLRAITKTNA